MTRPLPRPVLEYDDGPRWLPSLVAHLEQLLPDDPGERLRATEPEGPCGARFALYAIADKHQLLEATREWLLERDVFAYHGTRINAAQRRSIDLQGLRPLVAADRTGAIETFLRDHPRWTEVSGRLRSDRLRSAASR